MVLCCATVSQEHYCEVKLQLQKTKYNSNTYHKFDYIETNHPILTNLDQVNIDFGCMILWPLIDHLHMDLISKKAWLDMT